MRYTVSRHVDCREDVVVEADSFDEAFEKAKDVPIGARLEVIDAHIVNATLGNSKTKNYTAEEIGMNAPRGIRRVTDEGNHDKAL